MNDGVLRITVANLVIVTLMSFFGVTVAKLLLAQFYVNGLSEAVATG